MKEKERERERKYLPFSKSFTQPILKAMLSKPFLQAYNFPKSSPNNLDTAYLLYLNIIMILLLNDDTMNQEKEDHLISMVPSVYQTQLTPF